MRIRCGGRSMVIRLFVAFYVCVLWPSAAVAKRVALVIGNSAYRHTSPLTNPANDAKDIGAGLKRHGFSVMSGFDLDKPAFDAKVLEFATALENAEVGLFFYAGHGLQVNGQNYLVPTDAKLETVAALEFEVVRLDTVQRIMERLTSTNILFLDACRSNPLTRNLARALGTRTAEIGRGLAAVESGVGTLISFSTQPGNVALDGTGRNSPFAAALVKHIAGSNDDLAAILISVRNDVIRETQRKQVPWEHSSLTGRFYFKQGAPTTSSAPPSPPSSTASPSPPLSTATREAAEAWAAAKDTKSIAVLEDYVARYRDTFYAGLALARIEELRAQSAPVVAKNDAAPRPTRDAVRDTLYKTIMERLARIRASRNPAQSATENYRSARNPKALAVCIDWTRTTPTLLNSGEKTSAFNGRADEGCRGLTGAQCGRYAYKKCRSRGCPSAGQECLLVDIDGTNALKLDEAWAKQFAR